jgi:hypothetical protein
MIGIMKKEKSIVSVALSLCLSLTVITSVFAAQPDPTEALMAQTPVSTTNQVILATENVDKKAENVLEKQLLKKIGYEENNILDLEKNMNEKFNSKVNKKDVLRFAKLGYSIKNIETFTEKELTYLSNLEGTLIGVDTKYMKVMNDEVKEVTKEQHDNGIELAAANSAPGVLSVSSICNTANGPCSDSEPTASWMILTTTVSRISGTNPQEYLFKHDFTSSNTPSVNNRFKDAVGIAVPDAVTPIQNSEYMSYNYNKDYRCGLACGTTRSNETEYLWSANDKTGGMAFEFKLKSDNYNSFAHEMWTYLNHKGTVAYRGVRSNNTYTSLGISGHYIHTQSSYSGALGVSVTGIDMSISASVSQDKAIQTGVSFYF